MSNLSDYLESIHSTNTEALKGVGAFIGLLADLGGAISTSVGFFQFFASLIQPADDRVINALTNLQTTVTNGIKQVETQLAAQSLLAQMNAVDSVMDPAKTVFASLPDIVPRLPNDAIVNDALQKCLNAVIALRDDAAKWQAPWASPVAYTDGWSGTLSPPHGQFVFSYTYSLPQFLHSIGIFLAVVAALQPAALDRHRSDLIGCANKLQSVHDLIAAGLTGTKIPTDSDVASIGGSGPLKCWQPNWWDWLQGRPNPNLNFGGDPRLWPFGAVEPYYGASMVDSYWPFLPDMITLGSTSDKFFALLALRIENRKKALFAQLGFPVVRKTIRQVQAITGKPISTAPPYESWSLRNALNLLGVHLNGSGVFHSMLTFLRATPPYSGGLLFPAAADQHYPPAPLPKSFRSLFVHA